MKLTQQQHTAIKRALISSGDPADAALFDLIDRHGLSLDVWQPVEASLPAAEQDQSTPTVLLKVRDCLHLTYAILAYYDYEAGEWFDEHFEPLSESEKAFVPLEWRELPEGCAVQVQS